MAGLFALVPLTERFVLTATWAAAAFAFISSGFGVLAIFADRTKEFLELAFRQSKPDVAVDLAVEPNGKGRILIQPLNEVPFECDWCVVTLHNEIISAIGLEWPRIHPRKDMPVFGYEEHLNLQKVKNGYVELRFTYRSVHAPEFPKLQLSGKIFRRYKLSSDMQLLPEGAV